jgi:hypothetical protein
MPTSVPAAEGEVMHPLCLQCPDGATQFTRTRGLCPACYCRSRLAIRQKKTSWAGLERTGLALPAQQRGQAWKTIFGNRARKEL